MISSTSLRVLIIEDHAPTRTAVATALARAGFVPATVETLAAALATRADAHDVALVDLHLGPDSGIDAIRGLTSRGLPCVAFTVADDAPTVLEALAAGAVGYLLKDDPPAQVARALEEVAQGRTPISSGVAGHLLQALHPVATPGVHLTPREQDVLVALARGLTYAETAGALGLTIGTVQSYVKQVYGKLGVSTKTEACAWAIRHGLAP